MMGEYGYNTAATNSSIYGQHRPTFGEDGTGMPYNALLNMVGSSVLNQDISYDTSSKDPTMVRARVFIGNLVRTGVTRDDLIELCKPYGRLLAVTFFKVRDQEITDTLDKGYAFVQFSEGHEADTACTSLNGKRWKGTIIDVHLAMTGPGNKKKYVIEDISRKRRYDDFSREEATVLDETAEQNKRNRDIAVTDKTINDDLADSAMADTLICGGCRFVTCDYEVFKDHRIAGCRNVKADGEPKAIRCASCNQRFLSAWSLMCHLTDFHRMQLYREDENSFLSVGDDSNSDPIPAKRAPSPFYDAKTVPTSNSESFIGFPGGSSSVAPIGAPAAKSVDSDKGDETATDESIPVAPPVDAEQWNPMTGQTIVQTIPSLASGIPSGYGLR